MRYAIVATTGRLLLVDLQTKKVQALENSRPECYGISWFDGVNDLVLSHTGLDSATLTDINACALSERGWVSKGGWVAEIFYRPSIRYFAPQIIG